MRRTLILLVLAAALCAASVARAADEIVAADGTVTIKTPRYVVVFDGLKLTRLENRLTGEIYAAAGTTKPGEALKKMQGQIGLAVESLRPAVPVKYYRVSEKTRVSAAKTAQGAIITCVGLQHDEEFDPGMVFTLTLQVDAATGDLLIRPAVRAQIEEVIGVRDRGVLRCAIQLRNLSDDLRIIVPASDGIAFTKDNVRPEWNVGWRWPQHWEAALFIGEAPKGCFSVWADEPGLWYGRVLGLCHSAGAWHAAFEFETSDMIYRCTEIKDVTWRLNVFDGYWVKAAARYRQQMQAQWPDLQPLGKRTPLWADRVRVVLGNHIPSLTAAEKYAALVPRDTMVLFTSQGWLRGWNDGQIAKRGVGMDYFPNWPLDNPTHYEAADGVAASFTGLEKVGIHVFPYTNSTIVSGGQPWIRQKIGDRHFAAWRLWQRFYPEFCLDVVKRYGVSGIYEDCSWVVGRHRLGEPDGENWYNGGVRMRTYFRKLMPQIAVMGERNNEVTFRGQMFALSLTQWPDHAHPINSYIFEPFLRMWNIQLQPRGFDADDVRGWMTPWPSGYEENPIQERLMIRKRGIVFAREQLTSCWPETWDPAVMHYFKAKDGTEYRFVRDRGTCFVKMTPAGPSVLYWRLHGVPGAEVGTSGVEGWLGYDGNRIVGLNPKAIYIVLDTVRHPPVVISSVSPGFAISRCVVRDGFWLANVKRVDGKAEKGAESCTVRVRSDGQIVSFCGARAVKKLGHNEWEVRVAPPSGLGAYWTQPTNLYPGSKLTKLPARNTVHRRDNGVVSYYGREIGTGNVISQQDGSPENGEEGTIPWLVKVPEIGSNERFLKRSYLVFQYGSMHPYGDGANYMVRVNGRQLWKRYRPEQGPRDPKKPGEPAAIPLTWGAVNLERFAGQTVILELTVDGNRTGVSESIKWHNPVIQGEAPSTAEMDDEKGPPVAPGGETPLMDGGLE